MRVLSASVLLALAQFIAAQTPTTNAFNIPNGGYDIQAGRTVELTWNPTDGQSVTLTLRRGNPGALNDVQVIQANIPNNGRFSWQVPSDLPNGSDYAIQISDDQDDALRNFTPPLSISGGSASASSSGMTITTSTSSSTGTSTSSSGSTSSTGTTSSSSDSTTSSSAPVTTSTESQSSSRTPTPSTSGPSTSIQIVNPAGTGAAVMNRVEGAVAGLMAVGLGLGFAL